MSLTDDWKAGKLRKNKNYFVRRVGKKKAYPAHLYEYNAFSFCGNEVCYFPGSKQKIEVLAICDYDHFVELTKKVKALGKDVENLTNNYKLLESVQAVEIAHGPLVDEFGDCEAVYQEITRLRNENRQLCQILKESYSILEKDFQKETMAENFARNRWQKSLKILDKIDEVLK